MIDRRLPALTRAAALGLALLGAGCAHDKIRGTHIDDTPENREIVDLVSAYHRAVEARDADAVLAMVSNRFFEDNGNTDRSDDYDKRGLADTLKADFERTKALTLDIRVDEVLVDDETQHADAFILFSVRGQAELPAGNMWKTMTDRSRIRFAREGDKWLIVSGL